MRATVETPKGPVSMVSEPSGHDERPVVVLAHGAGTDMHHVSLETLAADLVGGGYRVVRFNFPYREAGRRAPDRMPTLLATFGAVLDAMHEELEPPWVVLAGRSMGGRVASHLARDRNDLRGLCFVSFPLHPAGRPGTERAAHLGELSLPMLFVQGTRDALADWSLLTPIVAGLPQAALHVVEDGDHSLRVPKRRADPTDVRRSVHDAVLAWLASLAV